VAAFIEGDDGTPAREGGCRSGWWVDWPSMSVIAWLRHLTP